MSFQQGLSGLSGAQRALDATSNNVANAATVGFKQSGAQFADIFAASLNGASGSQVGIGTMVGTVAQQFTQGNITVTNNALDVAINGGGFFRMSDNGTISYTRNGQYSVDKDGYIVNAQGLHLTGYAVDGDGTIIQGATADLRIQTTDIAPNTTTASKLVLNLDSRSKTPSAMWPGSVTGSAPASTAITAANNSLSVTVNGTTVPATIPVLTAPDAYTSDTLATAVEKAINAALPAGLSVDVDVDSAGRMIISTGTKGSGSTISVSADIAVLGGSPITKAGEDRFSISDPTSYTSSTSQTVFDTKGNPHTFTMYFAKTAAQGQWQLYTSLDGSTPDPTTNPVSVGFDSNGRLLTSMPLSETFDLTNGADDLDFTLDFTGSTEYGNLFGVNQMLQDGYTSGRLSGISISPEGVLRGNYSNGQTTNLGQIVLANFTNPNGLVSLGGNQWAESFSSGQPIVGVPTSGSLGVLQAASVEEANVDLTSEMVNMITQQRNYQANAQSIKTQDQMLQTLVNLR